MTLLRSLIVLLLGLTLAGCEMIEDQLDGNQPPAVSEFVAEPAEGEAPLLVAFSWELADLEGDTLTCILTYEGAARETVQNCGQVTDTFHTFEESGGYTVVLSVSDGLNTAAKSVAVRVLDPADEAALD